MHGGVMGRVSYTKMPKMAKYSPKRLKWQFQQPISPPGIILEEL